MVQRFFYHLSETVDEIVRWVTIALTLGFTLLIFVSVLTRYVFSYPIFWSQEVSKLLFIWGAFLAATLAFKRHSHIRFEFLNNVLGPRGLAITDLILYVSCLGFFSIILEQSIGFTRIVWATYFPVLEMSQGWLYVSVIVSAVIFLIHSVRLLFDSVENVKTAFSAQRREAQQ